MQWCLLFNDFDVYICAVCADVFSVTTRWLAKKTKRKNCIILCWNTVKILCVGFSVLTYQMFFTIVFVFIQSNNRFVYWRIVCREVCFCKGPEMLKMICRLLSSIYDNRTALWEKRQGAELCCLQSDFSPNKNIWHVVKSKIQHRGSRIVEHLESCFKNGTSFLSLHWVHPNLAEKLSIFFSLYFKLI